MFMDLCPQLVFSRPAKAVGPSGEAQGRTNLQSCGVFSDGVLDSKSLAYWRFGLDKGGPGDGHGGIMGLGSASNHL